MVKFYLFGLFKTLMLGYLLSLFDREHVAHKRFKKEFIVVVVLVVT